jgi:tetratricopeptide (TPR) repeat protein
MGMLPRYGMLSLAVALTGVIAPAAALGQDIAETPQPTAQALAEEIAAWAQRDRSGDPRAAKAALLELLSRAGADGTVPARARGELFTMLAVADFAQQDRQGALVWLDRAEAAYREAGDATDKQAEVLHNRGSILRGMRRLDEAEAAMRAALQMRRALHGEASAEVASSLSGLANILYSQGRYEDAVVASREGLAAQEAAAPDDILQIVIRLDTLATMLGESGRRDEAVRVARREEALMRANLATDHQWYGAALNTLGQTLLEAGLHEQAIPAIRETVDWRSEHLGREHPYTGASLMVLSVALEETGQLDDASELSAAGLAILRNHRDLMDTNTLAGFYHRIARIAAAQGNWTLYDERIASGFAEVDAALAEASPARAFLHVFHALQLYRRGRADEALPIAEEWVPRLQAALIPGHSDRILGEMLLGRLRQAAGIPYGQVLGEIDSTAREVSRKLSSLAASDSDLARAMQADAAAVLLYLETALAAGDQLRAFEAVQLATLSDLSLSQQRHAELSEGEGEADPARRAHLELIDRAREVRQFERRLAIARETAAGGDVQALESSRAAAAAALQGAEDALRRDFPDYVARYRPAPVPLDAFSASLAADDRVVIPLEAQDGGRAITIDRAHGLTWSRFDSAEVGRLVDGLRQALAGTGSAYPYADAAALYRMLLPQGVPTGGRVLLYGGQKVASLPLAALLTSDYSGPLDGAPWLVRDAAVQVIGNLAIHTRQREAAPSRPTDEIRVAGIGGADLPRSTTAAEGVQLSSLFRSGLPAIDSISGLSPLPQAAVELRAIAAALPGEDDLILVGPDAAEENLKRADLSQARVLAFATHGLVSGELKGLWEPALLVGTAEGSGEDGLLGASEIARLKLDADWVILSACNTAAGEDAGAPTYSGLASAFAQAGARSLMLSHWRVRDDAAARLSVGTVRGAAAGLPRAEALRQAQLALIADASVPGAAHPAIWAPFVIVEN